MENERFLCLSKLKVAALAALPSGSRFVLLSVKDIHPTSTTIVSLTSYNYGRYMTTLTFQHPAEGIVVILDIE